MTHRQLAEASDGPAGATLIGYHGENPGGYPGGSPLTTAKPPQPSCVQSAGPNPNSKVNFDYQHYFLFGFGFDPETAFFVILVSRAV